MRMANVYIISGCNGAGKTTSCCTVLPELLSCRHFINADEIAARLSPSNPESACVAAGRQMLKKITDLLEKGEDFAFETTLSARCHLSLIDKARQRGYKITLLYFWLDSPLTAILRVAMRVHAGGHNIPHEVIIRRYYKGLENLIKLYIPICDDWFVVSNMVADIEVIAFSSKELGEVILKDDIWKIIKMQGK